MARPRQAANACATPGSDDPAAHVSRSLADVDPAVSKALENEARRQRTHIELIASENVMSRAVREALGHEVGNKTLEGYPGRRSHGGGEHVDVVERLAIERAKALFGAALRTTCSRTRGRRRTRRCSSRC